MSGIRELWENLKAGFMQFSEELQRQEAWLDGGEAPVERPYANEHACRIRDPGDFQSGSFRRIQAGTHSGKGPRDGKKLSIIIGKLKGKTTTTTQAYRYPTSTWTEAQARAHCAEEKGTFEPAKKAGKEKREMEAIERFTGSPRNPFGTHSSYKFKGNYSAAWRCHFAKQTDLGPVRGTVRRTEMIAANMKPACELPKTESIGASTKPPDDCTYPETPGDYGLDEWRKPETDEDREGVKLSCEDLAVIKRAALGEIKRRAEEKEKKKAKREACPECGAPSYVDSDPLQAECEAIQAQRAVALGAIWKQVDMQVQQIAANSGPGEYLWVNDLYVDQGQIVAIISKGGKLYRAAVTLDGTTATLGALTEVEISFAPVRSGRISISRQADGHYRWRMIAETAVLNRVGEIDSRDLFDSFVAHAATEGYPLLDFYHDPRMTFGQADWVAREGYCYLASGLFDEEHPLATAFIDACEKNRGTWGASVAFVATEPPQMAEVAEGVTIPVYTAGINRRIAILPEDRAASWFTSAQTEVTRMRKEVYDALVELLGDEEKARQFAEQVDTTNRSIEEQGLVTRQGGEGESETPASGTEEREAPAAQGEPPAQPTVVADDALVAAIVAQLQPLLPAPVDLSALQAALGQLDERLKALEGGAAVRSALAPLEARLQALEAPEEDKRKRWQADLGKRAQQITATYRPTQQPKTPPPQQGQGQPQTPESSEAVASATLAAMRSQMTAPRQ